jgi:hypothetical protein
MSSIAKHTSCRTGPHVANSALLWTPSDAITSSFRLLCIRLLRPAFETIWFTHRLLKQLLRE